MALGDLTGFPPEPEELAQARATLNGNVSVESDDIEAACALTLAHRATQFPQAQDDTQQEPPPESEQQGQDQTDEDSLRLPQELLLEAIRALLPDDLLARIDIVATLRAAAPRHCRPFRRGCDSFADG